MDDIVRAQIDYYRARAGEYDEWFFRQGRYDRGPEANAAWFRELAEVEAALMAARPRGTLLELACGTGLWTRLLAPLAERVIAIDAVRETLDIARARVTDSNVTYIETDLFAWRPSERYDFIFFGFWISHIPRARWDAFWSMLERALAPGGTIFFVDNSPHAYGTSTRRFDHGADACEERILNDGRRFPIVKNFFAPPALEAELAVRGWSATVGETATFMLYGSAARSG